MKKCSKCLVLTFILASAYWQSVNAHEIMGATVLENALAKIQKHSSYSYAISMESDLYPDSSGVLSRFKQSKKGIVKLKRYGDLLKARMDLRVDETVYAFLFFRTRQRNEMSVIWDGKWIYTSNKLGDSYKMIDNAKNRGGNLLEDLYISLQKDEHLEYAGRQTINGIKCQLLRSQAETLAILLMLDKKATVAIDESTGFPVKIWASEGRSKTVLEFSGVTINPVVDCEVFEPSTSIKYKRLRGLEDAVVPGSAR